MHHRQASSRRMMFVMDEYKEAHNITDVADIDMDDFAQWALDNRKWFVTPPDPLSLIRRQASQALRDSFELDRQERLVRRYHHVIVEHPDTHEKIDRWVDITTAPPEQMRLSLGVRREAIYHDVHQLKTDVDSYNDNNRFGATLQMDFNFNVDIEERGFPGEYPAEPPDDGDD